MKPFNGELEGTWVTEEEDSDAEFSFVVKDGHLEVSGVCRSDGEAFEIEDIVWDGASLSFTAIMPSTGFKSKNSFRMRDDGKADLELTYRETWKKRKRF